ncbi:hypothetical protein HS088_TW03G00596 [Tripterygium wilfordii]|uniref:Uncharacterized protein n=1 Tax=Tripterygium wilfordii TaxID=458696 RepID=A0A7J7DV61_TRIWF|nr:hypothetical protein HS088_TW03G00596 [Tripterygium wilfordii]
MSAFLEEDHHLSLGCVSIGAATSLTMRVITSSLSFACQFRCQHNHGAAEHEGSLLFRLNDLIQEEAEQHSKAGQVDI